MKTDSASDFAVRQCYSARADEYTDLLGRMQATSPIDRRRIAAWADGIRGRILDAGCGPGHWTHYLHELGADIEGVDMVPEFIESASRRFPAVEFWLGVLGELPVAPGSLGGLLAWYSVIHVDPVRMPTVLRDFKNCLASGGSLLLGFFEGEQGMSFDHAVAPAYFWSIDGMSAALRAEGFEIVDVSTRQDAGSRPHAAIEAVC